MSKKDLKGLSLEELLSHKKDLDDIYDRLQFEIDNFSKAYRALREELKLRQEEIILEIDLLNEQNEHNLIEPGDMEKVLERMKRDDINIH